MTDEQTAYVKKCIREDNMHAFYTWRAWLRVRKEVLERDKYECCECRKRGLYKKATTVHHVNYVKNAPQFALEQFYEDDNGVVQKNLICLCHDCHERVHGYRIKPKKNNESAPLTDEKW